MRPGKILYVINEKSGSPAESNLESIITSLDADESNHLIYLLSGTDDRKKIAEKIESFKPQVIVAAGGDGTVNLVASVIKGKELVMGIIPLGSANGLAFELGIPEKPEDAIRLINEGEARPMDIVRINDDHISLHLSDVGINARIVKEFEKEGKRGFSGYIKHFFKELINPPPSFLCLIRSNDHVYRHKSLMTIIANASSYRTGANMNPMGNIDDGKFEIIVMKPHERWLWHSFIGAFTGTLHKKPNIETYQVTTAIINITPEQDLQVDGENLGKTTEVKADIQKHALHVILPPRSDS